MAPPSAVAYKGVNHAGPIACCHRRLLSGPKVAASGAVPVSLCPDIAAAFALQVSHWIEPTAGTTCLGYMPRDANSRGPSREVRATLTFQHTI